MQTLRSLGWLVDFIVGSLLWSIAIVLAAFLAPFALVGFFPLADLLQLIVSVRFRTGSSGIGQAGGGRFSQSSINFVLWNFLSNAFTSGFKELGPIPQFKLTAKLGEFLESKFSQSF